MNAAAPIGKLVLTLLVALLGAQAAVPHAHAGGTAHEAELCAPGAPGHAGGHGGLLVHEHASCIQCRLVARGMAPPATAPVLPEASGRARLPEGPACRAAARARVQLEAPRAPPLPSLS